MDAMPGGGQMRVATKHLAQNGMLPIKSRAIRGHDEDMTAASIHAVRISQSKAAQPFRRSNERARVGSAGTWPAGREGRAVKKPSATARRTQPLAP